MQHVTKLNKLLASDHGAVALPFCIVVYNCTQRVGRYLCCIPTMTLLAEHVRYLVLDEADKMLSLGLEPQLKRIRALVIPRKKKAEEAGAGVLAKPHTRQQRPQASTQLASEIGLKSRDTMGCHCHME